MAEGHHPTKRTASIYGRAPHPHTTWHAWVAQQLRQATPFGAAFSEEPRDTYTVMERPSSVTAWIEAARIKAMQGIEKDEKLKDDESRAKAKEIVGELLDVAKETAEAGTFDGGAVVELEPGKMTVAMGGTVSSGAKLESALKELAEMAKSNSDFAGEGIGRQGTAPRTAARQVKPANRSVVVRQGDLVALAMKINITGFFFRTYQARG